MTEYLRDGAWGTGLATLAAGRVLDVYYPDPRLGAEGAPDAATEVSVSSFRSSCLSARHTLPTLSRAAHELGEPGRCGAAPPWPARSCAGAPGRHPSYR